MKHRKLPGDGPEHRPAPPVMNQTPRRRLPSPHPAVYPTAAEIAAACRAANQPTLSRREINRGIRQFRNGTDGVPSPFDRIPIESFWQRACRCDPLFHARVLAEHYGSNDHRSIAAWRQAWTSAGQLVPS